MELKYKDYFRSNHKNEVRKIYMNSFLKNERFPFFLLKHCSKEKNVIFNEILDNDKTIGMEYIIECSDFVYLMYLAIDKNKQGNGYGSKALDDLKRRHKTLILIIERPDRKIIDDRIKRKKFYLKNGFYETNKFIEDNGIQYEILCTKKDYIVTKEKMKERYTKMTNSIIVKYLITKLFNANNINFIK